MVLPESSNMPIYIELIIRLHPLKCEMDSFILAFLLLMRREMEMLEIPNYTKRTRI